ncbi:hypothetical protein HHK36_016182 [Tetracentron sinense]|uniref:V-SNARE coiled-coil homology domain-containing protein n=1 Tax=Tetracentron sinense TaxID=13715 RepID=A0A834Z2A6_TETSI|nr:hypothetical protein HHK36_016182 [Tetracentron sinense]
MGDPLIDRHMEFVKMLEEHGLLVVAQFDEGNYHAIKDFIYSTDNNVAAAKSLQAKKTTRVSVQHGSLTLTDLDPRIVLHYGIPSTASILTFDSIQRLLAIGTLDGRIKVIGGDNIEGLLVSPKQLPYKSLEFLQNQGFLVSVSNENDIQVWDLEHRCIACCLQWESNITAFSVIYGTNFMYVGDEYGLMSVLKYDAEGGKLLHFPYSIPANSITEAAGISVPNNQSIVGVLPQPCTSGNRQDKKCLKVLIAYENGLIILWDVSEAQVVLVRGYKDLQLKEVGLVDSSDEMSKELPDGTSDHEQGEKEISSLCWVSSSGSILAVGYVDGDIMLWNTSNTASTKGQQAGVSSNNVVKLQLSSGKRRLPVIVLRWSANSRSHNDCGGQLFIYGGDEIGSEEVLTVLSLEWSSGIETLRSVSRVDLTLNGSFADMILVPTAGAMENNHTAALFVLTNPGQMHIYDDASLSALTSQQEKKPSVHSVQFPVVIPTGDPCMTVAKLSLVLAGGNLSKTLSEASTMKLGATPTVTAGMKWPLTGGVPSQLSFSEDNGVERVFIAGYQDGSVRIWDATYPVLSLIFVLEGELQGVKVAGASAAVSALDFCSLTLSLAVGNECGLVHVYKLSGNSEGTTFHFVTETKREDGIMHQGKGFQCTAVFALLNSPIRTLQHEHSGAILAVGFECGRVSIICLLVAVLDISLLSVLFLTDCVSGSSSPVISTAVKASTDIHSLVNSPKHSVSKSPDDPSEGIMFILTRDAHVVAIDSVTEGSIPVSELSNEKNPPLSSQDSAAMNESLQTNTHSEIKSQEVNLHTPGETTYSGERLLDSLADNKSIHKVNLVKPCCWTTTFKKDDKVCGLILLYQTGVIEIRSLPDLKVVGESSLMSILRWSFKANMDKTMSSSENGQITLANGSELAFISLLAFENDFRIPEFLPCLHDKVLAAAADSAFSFSSNQKKKQGTTPGILGGIIKGFKGGKVRHTVDTTESLSKSNFMHLESIFSRVPYADPSTTITAEQEVAELNIDDIEINEPVPVASTSSHKGKNDRRVVSVSLADKETEREKLFQGATVETKPRLRKPEEIMAKYRKAGDASAAAAHAKDKLVQRQEKLERISRRTEELQSGAENFASMANEIVKTMEGSSVEDGIPAKSMSVNLSARCVPHAYGQKKVTTMDGSDQRTCAPPVNGTKCADTYFTGCGKQCE